MFNILKSYFSNILIVLSIYNNIWYNTKYLIQYKRFIELINLTAHPVHYLRFLNN